MHKKRIDKHDCLLSQPHQQLEANEECWEWGKGSSLEKAKTLVIEDKIVSPEKVYLQVTLSRISKLYLWI